MKAKLKRHTRKLRKQMKKLKRASKVASSKAKSVRWLLPGWVGYEYYKVHKRKGHSKGKSVVEGVKAEGLRLAATASVPVPGMYEITTVGLASLKRRIEKDELKKLTLKALREASPMKRKSRKKGSLRKI